MRETKNLRTYIELRTKAVLQFYTLCTNLVWYPYSISTLLGQGQGHSFTLTL